MRKLIKIIYPDEIKTNQRVFIEGIVTKRAKKNSNYVEIQILDGICGLNSVKLLVHGECLLEDKNKQ